MSTSGPQPGDPDADPRRLEFVGVELLGLYDVKKRLATGGMGTVYLAEDRTLDRNVVIKVPHARFLSDERFLARFSREIGELVRLEHPHIVRIFAQGEHDGVPFFVLQYLGGGSLEDRMIEKGGPLSIEGTLAWARTIADTLDFIHARGTIHRDVKPANILFDEQRNVYLSDFGVAKVLSVESMQLTDEHVLVGSPEHMAPEQGLGGDLTPSADQYALASMIYTAWSGRAPFSGDSPVQVMVQKNHDDPTPLVEVAADVPAAASDVVHRALSRNPDDRFASCSAFVGALEQAFKAPEVVPVAPPERSRALLYTLLVLLAATIIWAWSLDDPSDNAQESLDAMMVAYESDPPSTEAEFRSYIERLKRTGGKAAEHALQVVYTDFVAGPGANDVEARRALGYREFTYERNLSPKESFAYPYFRGVELARERRWFGKDEDELWRLATDARQRAERHDHGMASDRVMRATHALRLQAVEANPGRYFVWHWSAPFFLAFVSSTPLSEYALLDVDEPAPYQERAVALREARSNVEQILEEEGRLLAPLHRTFLREFGAALELDDLMSDQAGRPDGVPLLVMAFENLHELRRGTEIPPFLSRDCIFVPSTGALCLLAARQPGAPKDAEERTNRVLREAAHQLQFWFSRQRHGWSHRAFALDWFTLGVAEWLGGLRVDLFRQSATPGVNEQRRKSLRMTVRRLNEVGTFRFAPLETLTGARNLYSPTLLTEIGPNPGVAAIRAVDQSWALVHFLRLFEDGRYRDRFLEYADRHGFGRESAPGEAFENVFGIDSEDDWRQWDEDFRKFVFEELLNERGR